MISQLYNNMKKIFLIILAGTFLLGCYPSVKNDSELAGFFDFFSKPTILETIIQKKEKSPSIKGNQTKTEQAGLLSSTDLKVPFVSQAPLANWDDLHNEACEEAAVLNVVLYLENEKMSKNEADKKLIEMVNWQESHFGGHFDLPVEKVKEFIQGYYNYQVRISYDISLDSIKKELAQGNPVIVPASGRTLGNPNFRQPGPVYHMLVIRGYDDKKSEFITNDVGTRKGEGYRYQYQKLFDAIHDMPKWRQTKSSLDADPNMIFSGRKAMMVIKK